jgi:hypothetical protein
MARIFGWKPSRHGRIDTRDQSRPEVAAGMRGVHRGLGGEVIGGYTAEGQPLGTKANRGGLKAWVNPVNPGALAAGTTNPGIAAAPVQNDVNKPAGPTSVGTGPTVGAGWKMPPAPMDEQGANKPLTSANIKTTDIGAASTATPAPPPVVAKAAPGSDLLRQRQAFHGELAAAKAGGNYDATALRQRATELGIAQGAASAAWKALPGKPESATSQRMTAAVDARKRQQVAEGSRLPEGAKPAKRGDMNRWELERGIANYRKKYGPGGEKETPAWASTLRERGRKAAAQGGLLAGKLVQGATTAASSALVAPATSGGLRQKTAVLRERAAQVGTGLAQAVGRGATAVGKAGRKAGEAVLKAATTPPTGAPRIVGASVPVTRQARAGASVPEAVGAVYGQQVVRPYWKGVKKAAGVGVKASQLGNRAARFGIGNALKTTKAGARWMGKGYGGAARTAGRFLKGAAKGFASR